MAQIRAGGGGAGTRPHEAEDFQAVGMRCREALVEFAKEVAPSVEVRPRASSGRRRRTSRPGLILPRATVSPGSGGRQLAPTCVTWPPRRGELVGWLTHAANARRFDGIIAGLTRRATSYKTFSMALIRHERGGEERGALSAGRTAFIPTSAGTSGRRKPTTSRCARSAAGTGERK